MDSIETLIPDGEGNYLVVALTFYDERTKSSAFQLPEELRDIKIADISINKLLLDEPLGLRAFLRMCDWLVVQIETFGNAVFSFVCSLDSIASNHSLLRPEEYRWMLFNLLYHRNIGRLKELGIESMEIVVGPEGYQTFARVFYNSAHSAIVNVIAAHLRDKYSE